MTDHATPVQRVLRWTVFLGVTALIAYACLLILSPFVNVIAWSIILAVSFYPVHERLVRKTGRVTLSAFVSSVVVVFALVIPLIFIIGLALNQLMSVRDYAQQAFAGGFQLSAVEPLRRGLEWLSRRTGFDLSLAGNWIVQHANQLGEAIAAQSLTFAAGLTSLVVSFVFTVFAIFLLFRDGERMLTSIPELMPFERRQSEAMVAHIRDAVYGSVYGMLVVAVVQGVMCGVMFWILGIPSALLWGTATVLTSLLPIGAAAVWVPATIYLIVVNRWPQAIVLAVWGTFVVSTVDNLLRPRLIGNRIGLSEFVLFFAILGGLQVFGVLGIVLGPVLFAIAASILHVLSSERV